MKKSEVVIGTEYAFSANHGRLSWEHRVGFGVVLDVDFPHELTNRKGKVIAKTCVLVKDAADKLHYLHHTDLEMTRAAYNAKQAKEAAEREARHNAELAEADRKQAEADEVAAKLRELGFDEAEAGRPDFRNAMNDYEGVYSENFRLPVSAMARLVELLQK